MSKWNTIKAIRRKSEIARIKVNKRWSNERSRQAAIAAADPIQFTGQIIRRIVVVDRERTAREVVIYDFDSARSARAKLKRILSPAVNRVWRESRTGFHSYLF